MDTSDFEGRIQRLYSDITASRTSIQEFTQQSISMNVVALGGLGFAIKEDVPPLLIVAACVGMFALCLNWRQQMQGHREGLAARYQVLMRLEGEQSGGGGDLQRVFATMRRKLRVMNMDRVLPTMFGLAYVVLIAMIVPWPGGIPKPDWWPLFSLETFAN